MSRGNSRLAGAGNRFRTAVSNTYNKTKTYVSNTYSSAKTKAKEYKGHMNVAYNVGYKSGVNDYPSIPKVVGARTSATTGYSRALKDARRNEKFQNKTKNL